MEFRPNIRNIGDVSETETIHLKIQPAVGIAYLHICRIKIENYRIV